MGVLARADRREWIGGTGLIDEFMGREDCVTSKASMLRNAIN